MIACICECVPRDVFVTHHTQPARGELLYMLLQHLIKYLDRFLLFGLCTVKMGVDKIYGLCQGIYVHSNLSRQCEYNFDSIKNTLCLQFNFTCILKGYI